MTAEIAVLNKSAVALAADSAVTIEQQEGQKVYNTVNKLFSLSKYQPVGIMVYGNADFMGIPWETIIKFYRKQLGKREFNHLKDYANDFIKFLHKDRILFSETAQETFFYLTIISFFNFIKNEIDQQVTAEINTKGKVDEVRVKKIVSETIKKHYDQWKQFKFLPTIPQSHARKITGKYAKLIRRAKEDVFQKQSISKKSLEQLKETCGNIFSKDWFPGASGVVIAGFGRKDIYPSTRSFLMEALNSGRLKYKELIEKSGDIDDQVNARIIPFAQDQMVGTFMEGIDRYLENVMKRFLSAIFNQYPEDIVKTLPNINNTNKPILIKKLRRIGTTILNEFMKRMDKHKEEKHIGPIMRAVAFLPKDELAAMAESLVNLTSFRQKISTEIETVGGPIDVAIISKGDGFVWIKRKHYFKPELNPGFFANYYRG